MGQYVFIIMENQKYSLVPPDGGYGWVIVFASALSNFILIPLLQGAGLIFRETFAELNLTAAEGSLIINLNASFGMLIGLINGSLLKTYGYRKVSYLGAAFASIGFVLTSFASTFTELLFTYGIIASFGLGMTTASYSLAINTYFKKNLSRAVSINVTITGLGPIIMPQIINLLILHHTNRGVILILGGICTHGFIAAALLQPAKWHMKKVVIDHDTAKVELEDEETETTDTLLEKRDEPSELSIPRPRTKSTSSNWSNEDAEAGAMYGLDSNLGGSVLSLASVNARRAPEQLNTTHNKTKAKWWKSTSAINLDSSVDIFKNNKTNMSKNSTEVNLAKTKNNKEGKVYDPEMTVAARPDVKEVPLWRKVLLRLSDVFDLDLLNDPIYVNIMLGMSLAIFAELNFSVLTPFILGDFHLNTPQIATFLSVLGIADILFRFLAPYIGEWLKQPPRPMYMLTLFGLISTRFTLLVFSDYTLLLGVAVLLGLAKGVRTVYMSLVIPTYVPLEKLASASGIQMMVNGIFILIGGPIIGVVRDQTGSYSACIVIMNMVTFTTIMMWSVEMLVRRYKERNQSST